MFGFGNKTEYQLVVEFNDDSPENFQRVADMELLLDDKLETGEVDGNDVGQGIVNLFVFTKQPQKCFEEMMGYFKSAQLEPSAAAYRDVDGEDYFRLWPANDKTPFKLK